MRYTPFDRDFRDIEASDLKNLETAAEGWYIEYKRQSVSVKSIGKSISAFANHYGGWLFIGVEEGEVDGSKCAKAFPGIPVDELERLQLSIRTGAVHHVSPTPLYDVKVLKGPAASIQLNEGRAVVVVRVPEGGDAPYVHSSGRIYRRKADESDPVPETDRAVLDLLWERRRRGEDRIRDLIEATPSVSRLEWDQCAYLHVHLLANPLAAPSDQSSMSLTDFRRLTGLGEPSERMQLGLDNVFRCGDDYVGRHVYGNNPEGLTLTYRYRPDCSALLSVPISILRPRRSSATHDDFVGPRRHGVEFLSLTLQEGHTDPKVADLSPVLLELALLIRKHREVALQDGVRGPFHVKIVLDNVWRVVPFIDTDWYLDRIKTFGTPIMQDKRLVVPWLLPDFIELDPTEPDVGEPASTDPLDIAGGSLDVILTTLGSLGVPIGLETGGKATHEVVELIEAGLRTTRPKGDDTGSQTMRNG